MHVLLDDDLGRLTVQRVSPWHRLLSRVLAARLDLQLASGTRPEANALLAARAMFLTSVRYRRARLALRLASGTRRGASALLAARAIFLTSARSRRALATSLRRMLAASAVQLASPHPMAEARSPRAALKPHFPLRRDLIAGSA